MQQETEWIDQAQEKEAYKYFMRVDPDMRDFLGPIERVDDSVTGREMRRRRAKIGMVRGTKTENMKEVTVYLDPAPHKRIDNPKQLQGWYQAKHEDRWNSRVRPCMTDAVLTQPYGGYCTVGCDFSLVAGELIDTPGGPKKIENIQPGDLVWGKTHSGTIRTTVLNTTHHWKPEGYIILKLNDGRKLKVTADHPVYSTSRGTWIQAGELNKGEQLEQRPPETFTYLRDMRKAEDTEIHRSKVLRRLQTNRDGQDVNGHEREQTRIAKLTEETLSMRDHYTTSPESMRPLSIDNPQSERIKVSRETWKEHRAEINQDAPEYEQSRDSSAIIDVSQSKLSQVSGMEICSSGEGSLRHKRVSNFQTMRVHRSQRAANTDEINLGGIDSDLVGQAPVQLGIRTDINQPAGSVGVYPRFPVEQRRILGSERISNGSRIEENRASEIIRVQDNSVRSKGDGAYGYPRVDQVVPMVGGCYVYDIETTTGNFYTRGILVHNCYINSGTRGYRGTGLMSVPLDYGAFVQTSLKKMRTSAAGYFSSFIDPFLPLEDYYHNTRAGAQAFVDDGLPIFFLSRLEYPGWAYDLLTRNPYSYMQKSINTPDENDWRKLSPGAAPLEQHFEQIREAKRRGIYVSIQCNPVMAGITTHEEIEELFGKLAAVGVDHVIVKFVEADHPWAPSLVTKITKRFGDNRAAAFRELFTCNSAGGQKTIDEAYRLEGHRRYRERATDLGMTYASCYEYRKLESGRHVSIGAEVLTADQCHGHRVPMFTRLTRDAPFTEVAECPPSGCLSCANKRRDRKGACGSELFGAAKALRFTDFKTPVYG